MSEVPARKPLQQGICQTEVPLARHTTWRVGGEAKQLYWPLDRTDLCEFLRNDPSEAYHWLGLGSNSLIRDGGIQDTVILTHRALNQMDQRDTLHVEVEAGVPCAKLARFVARSGLKGGEFLAGIPGTLGGALTMNAGCHGDETWNHVRAVITVDQQGELHQRTPDEFQVSYREVIGKRQEWFVAATLEFELDPQQQALKRIADLLAHRAATQPTSDHNAGSVFRNPPGDYAARLIEAAGLKGFQLGGAQVSQKHANFIINQDNATAKDIESLIQHVAAVVQDRFNVPLHTEVKIIGDSLSLW